MEETTRETIQRLRQKAAAIGLGRPANAVKLARTMKAQRPPQERQSPASDFSFGRSPTKKRIGREGRRIRCLDTGEEWSSALACVRALGSSHSGLAYAFKQSSEKPRVAVFKGRRYVYVDELPQVEESR